MPKPFYAYMLKCSDNSYYTGHTEDLEIRLWEHQEGSKCVYTSCRRPVELVWCQEFGTRNEAKEAEAQIKRWTRAKKESLIRGDFQAVSAAAKKNWNNYKARQAEQIA